MLEGREPDADDLISCIMVTKDRPHFFQRAIRYFKRQTYVASELIVVDDGAEPVGSYCAGVDRVRYIRLHKPTTTGMKLNIGIEHARSDLLQKMDDDDYYHPDFLKIAMAHVPSEDRDSQVVCWDCFLVYIAGDEQLRYSGHGWSAGNSLCFTRNFWARAPFRDLARGSDSFFIRDQPGGLVRVHAPEHCIVIRHGGNTWTDMQSGESVEDYFRKFAVYEKKLAELVPEDDRIFYESLDRVRPIRTASPGISA